MKKEKDEEFENRPVLDELLLKLRKYGKNSKIYTLSVRKALKIVRKEIIPQAEGQRGMNELYYLRLRCGGYLKIIGVCEEKILSTLSDLVKTEVDLNQFDLPWLKFIKQGYKFFSAGEDILKDILKEVKAT